MALGLVAALAGCAGSDGPAPAAGGRHHDVAVVAAGAPAPTRHIGPQGDVGQFVTDCGYSHSAPDDPIVHPGKPGYSHVHDFFGNVTTDADSTLASLLPGGTTCQIQLDTAAYWAPRLLRGTEPITPTKATAYYRAAPGVDPTTVQPFPPGLKAVAGDMTADPTRPQDPDLAGWACGTGSTNHSSPPVCPSSAPLRAVITFPDCWDGRHLDSEDHRAHLANSAAGRCPRSHPVHLPQLTFAVTYPVTGDVAGLALASGAVEGAHADFLNAWHQGALVNEVESCIRRDAVCSLSSNRGEEPLFAG